MCLISVALAVSIQEPSGTCIRPMLDKKSANTLACSTILSRLDYCNDVLGGVSQQNLSRLQLAQNSAARVVLLANRRANSAALLKQLHWLPVAMRIKFKVALPTYKALSLSQPSYIRSC